MAVITVNCIHCKSKEVVKYGKAQTGEQRYRCQGDCKKTFQLSRRYNACEQGVKEQIIAMALNGSGIRDGAVAKTIKAIKIRIQHVVQL